MIKVRSTFPLIMSLIFVVACGGSDDKDEKLSINVPDPEGLYSGIANPAVLTSTNTESFAFLLLGNSKPEPLISRGTSNQQKNIIENQLSIIDDTISVIRSIVLAHSVYAQRVISETSACTHGGSVLFESDATVDEYDSSLVTGTVIYTFDNCEESVGNILDGSVFQKIDSPTRPESYTLGYDQFKVIQGDEIFTLVGNVELYDTSDYGNTNTRTRNELVNILSIHSPSGIETYLENYNIDTTLNRYPSGATKEHSSINGKAYISNEGYVTISTSDDFAFFKNDTQDVYYVPYQGSLYFTGASKSQARIPEHGSFPTSNLDTYRLDLDIDGDGGYELISIQDQTTLESESFTTNEPPFLYIRSGVYSELTSYTPASTTTLFRMDQTVHLYAEAYDNDNDRTTLNYQWNVEDSPTGSTVQVNTLEVSDSQSIFKPDAFGNYKISVKVSDPLGGQQSTVEFIDIKILNYTPESTYIYYDEFPDPVLGERFEFTFWVKDIDHPIENNILDVMTVTHEWIEKPIGSSITLETVINPTREEWWSTWDWEHYIGYAFMPDKTGKYSLKLTVTDPEGESDTQTIDFFIP